MAKRSKKKPRSTGKAPVAQVRTTPSSTAVAKSGPSWPWALQATLIAAVVLWIYWPALHGGWLMDDVNYITRNPLLRDMSGLWKIWFEPGSFIEYYPLKASVEWMEWNLMGNDTLGYHLLNVALHAVNALLVWRLLAKFGLRLAWLGGLIFAVHPAMVETVAWISELKNTLSLAPFLLAMIAWIDYEERKKTKDYVLALGLFLVTMLCKISAAPFPVVILLYAWWKRERVGWSDLKASAPFFVISLILGTVLLLTASWFQAHRMVLDPVPMGGFFSRVACAGLVLSHYLGVCLCPVDLMPVYPRWTVDPPSLLQFLPWPVFGGILYWFWRERRGWGKHLLLGLGFFVLNLMPFLGFKTVSYMSYTWVMDHFLYLPIIGLIGPAVAGLELIAGRVSPVLRSCGIAVIGFVIALLAWESHNYAAVFLDSGTFSAFAVKQNPGAWTAHNDLGVALQDAGKFDDATRELEESMRLNPDYLQARYNLGNTLLYEKRWQEAIDQYEQVLKVQPRYPEAHNNIAVALARMGRLPEAIGQFKAELELYPDDAATRDNLAKVEKLQEGAAQKP